MTPFDLNDYEAKYADHYVAGELEPVMVAARRRRVLASVGDVSGRRVLEVGCGMEPVAAFLDTAAQRTVVEPAKRFVDAARDILAADPASRAVQGFLEDAVEQGEVRGPFDVIVVSSLLHEVPDPRRLLRSIRALCAPNALVHVNVPNVRSFHRLLALEMGLIDDLFEQSETERRFQRHTRFDLAGVRALVQAEGFRVEESGTYFIKPFTHDQMQRALEAGVIDDAVLRGLEAMTRYLPDMGAELYVDLRPD
jgi:SAM-dependent methyltransferase